jgi:hypothetical protein
LGLRLLTGNGLTANPGNLGPDVGMKWKIIYAQIVITAGSGTGTRQALLVYSAYNQGSTGSPYGLYLINSGTSSGSVTGQGGILSTGNSPVTVWNDYPILEHTGVISFNNQLISGDSLNYTILVDEEADF